MLIEESIVLYDAKGGLRLLAVSRFTAATVQTRPPAAVLGPGSDSRQQLVSELQTAARSSSQSFQIKRLHDLCAFLTGS